MKIFLHISFCTIVVWFPFSSGNPVDDGTVENNNNTKKMKKRKTLRKKNEAE